MSMVYSFTKMTGDEEQISQLMITLLKPVKPHVDPSIIDGIFNCLILLSYFPYFYHRGIKTKYISYSTFLPKHVSSQHSK